MRATPEELNVCRKGVKCIAPPGGCNVQYGLNLMKRVTNIAPRWGAAAPPLVSIDIAPRWGAAQGAAWSLDIFHELLEERISEVARFTHAGLAPSESKAEQFLKP
jgi:hypothetical protein